MDFEMIIAAAGALLGGGGLVALFTVPELRKAKRLENEGAAIEQYKELLNKYALDLNDARTEIAALRKRCDSLSDQCGTMKTQMATLEAMYEQANVFRCTVIQCQKRRPPLDSEKLKEIAGLDDNDNDNDNDTDK